jgi:hypothetical protein
VLSDASRPVEVNLSTGRTPYWNRQHLCRPVEVNLSTGRTPYWNRRLLCRPVEKYVNRSNDFQNFWRPIATFFPDMNPYSGLNQDVSYASIASMAKGSFCKACSLSKLGSRPSYAKDTKETIPFLHRIQGDICGPIHPYCGPFRYFMVLMDASTRWSHVALLSTHNAAYTKLLAQVIRLRAHHPNHPIMSNMS